MRRRGSCLITNHQMNDNSRAEWAHVMSGGFGFFWGMIVALVTLVLSEWVKSIFILWQNNETYNKEKFESLISNFDAYVNASRIGDPLKINETLIKLSTTYNHFWITGSVKSIKEFNKLIPLLNGSDPEKQHSAIQSLFLYVRNSGSVWRRLCSFISNWSSPFICLKKEDYLRFGPSQENLDKLKAK